MLFVFQETVSGYSFALFTTETAMVSNGALFISNNNFDTRFKNGLFEVFFVIYPIFRVGAHNIYFRIANESLGDFLNILSKCRIAEEVKLVSRSGLMSRHCCGLVI